MPEVDIENRVCERALHELGVRSIKLNLQGNRSWPDRLFFIPGGRPLLIEFKLPGEDLDPRQGLIADFLIYNQYDYATHTTVEGALRAIQRCLDAAVAAGWHPSPERGRSGAGQVGAPRLPEKSR